MLWNISIPWNLFSLIAFSAVQNAMKMNNDPIFFGHIQRKTLRQFKIKTLRNYRLNFTFPPAAFKSFNAKCRNRVAFLLLSMAGISLAVALQLFNKFLCIPFFHKVYLISITAAAFTCKMFTQKIPFLHLLAWFPLSHSSFSLSLNLKTMIFHAF